MLGERSFSDRMTLIHDQGFQPAFVRRAQRAVVGVSTRLLQGNKMLLCSAVTSTLGAKYQRY